MKGINFMKILVYKWDIFPYNDIIDGLKEQGHLVDVLAFPITSHIKDKPFEEKLAGYLQAGRYDAVFSVNYFTVISNICQQYNINYISWTCDAPLLSMRNPSIYNPVNTIYVFDKKEYGYFHNKGADTVKYLPLAGAPERISRLLADYPGKYNRNDNNYTGNKKYSYNISFVGNLYDKNRYDEMAAALPPYLCGYMDAVIEAQLNVSGGNIINLLLTDEIIDNAKQYIDIKNQDCPGTDISYNQDNNLYNNLYNSQDKNLYGNLNDNLKIHLATSVLSYKTASLMRTSILNSLGDIADVHLFTTSGTGRLFKVITHPPVRYLNEMPFVFASSKINLNITIPNIEDGIPLRVFDILSAGGFLMTDYRPELENLFDIGRELVVYDGEKDLIAKALYYLENDKERELIRVNGFDKLRKLHTYKHRIKTMFGSSRPTGFT